MLLETCSLDGATSQYLSLQHTGQCTGIHSTLWPQAQGAQVVTRSELWLSLRLISEGAGPGGSVAWAQSGFLTLSIRGIQVD